MQVTAFFQRGDSVASVKDLDESLQALEDLSGCLELKLGFPFEEIILESVLYAGLIVETEGSESDTAGRLQRLEKIVKMYLAYPAPEVRERIIRRFYQKLRTGTGAVAHQKTRAADNLSFLARFILRKGMLNQLVNGLLINKELAEFEESKLQMSLGSLIVKTIILSFNEM